MSKIYYCSIAELSKKIKAKEISPVEITDIILARIQSIDKQLNSFITVMSEQAIISAKKAEEEIMRGDYRGPLHGIPIGVKDLIYTKEAKTTAGSKILKDFIPEYDATVVKKLKQSGAILIGKHNMQEYAFGATRKNPFENARNPWNVEYIAGGSSSGSAAAVAAGLSYGALGSDTAGSIRIPAAFCGIFGLKPTYGRVSKYGVTPLAWSLDHIGPMARSAQDLEMLYDAIAGYDELDKTTFETEGLSSKTNSEGLENITIGIPTHYFNEQIDVEVERAVTNVIAKMETVGAKIKEITIPELELAEFALFTILRVESAAYHHENLKEKPEAFSEEVRRSLQIGELVSGVDYVRAQQARQLIQQAFRQIYQQVDVIIAPTVSILPPKVGERDVELNGKRTPLTSQFVRLTLPANVTGFPALSMPIGFSSKGLPIGLQLLGKPLAEIRLLKIGSFCETAWTYLNRYPIE